MIEGKKLGNRSRLGERQGPWLSHSLTQSLTELLTHFRCSENAGARAVTCKFTFQTLPVTSQDGLSPEFVAATAGRELNIQDARGGGLCTPAFPSGPAPPAGECNQLEAGGEQVPPVLNEANTLASREADKLVRPQRVRRKTNKFN